MDGVQNHCLNLTWNCASVNDTEPLHTTNSHAAIDAGFVGTANGARPSRMMGGHCSHPDQALQISIGYRVRRFVLVHEILALVEFWPVNGRVHLSKCVGFHQSHSEASRSYRARDVMRHGEIVGVDYWWTFNVIAL